MINRLPSRRKLGEVMNLLLEFARNLSTTLVVVTHDRILAEQGDRTLEIVDGQMIGDKPGLAGVSG